MSTADFEQSIFNEVKSANDMFNSIISFISALDPSEMAQSASFAPIITVVQSFAGGIFTLVFLIEFFRKTLDFGWVKIENLMLFMAKTMAAWGVVSQSTVLMSSLYNAFAELFTNIGALSSGGVFNMGGTAPEVTANIVGTYSTTDGFFVNLGRSIQWLSYMPTFLILKLIMVVTLVIVVGIFFELLIYMVVAPLPLATFSSEATSDIGKGFIKSFIAVAMQTFVIGIVFKIYGIIVDASNVMLSIAMDSVPKQIQLLIFSAILLLGVVKSGSWAKKITGAM